MKSDISVEVGVYSGWVPAADRLPEETIGVLVSCLTGRSGQLAGIYRDCCVAYLECGTWMESYSSREVELHGRFVTHWQPLPPPPA